MKNTKISTCIKSKGKEQQEFYDVYVAEPTPLQEGVEKHTISVFVADETGLINRVASVFARRGANIESLAVSLDLDKALFTIVSTGTPSLVLNLVKQLKKLVKVRYVEDVTSTTVIERELVMIKIRSPPGPVRTKVMQLTKIFRARTVDVSEKSLTLAVTGDLGKMTALYNEMATFAILDVSRTGIISLKRGEELLETGSKATKDRIDGLSQEDQKEEFSKVNKPRSCESYDVFVDEHDVVGLRRDETTINDAHTLSIDVRNLPGVLNQVVGVFTRRGYNVQSLAVGPCEREGMSRITMVMPSFRTPVLNLLRQVLKVVAVESVTNLSQRPIVYRELMLIKIRAGPKHRSEIRDLVQIFHGDIVDVSKSTVTVAVTGTDPKLSAFQDLCTPYDVLVVARTGRVSLIRDSGVDTRYLEGFEKGELLV